MTEEARGEVDRRCPTVARCLSFGEEQDYEWLEFEETSDEAPPGLADELVRDVSMGTR